jgi:acyl-CoA synthetase (AMP-forming)/AMP-acid ligase II
MITPLTISDFLNRAALVYPDRTGIIDEPDQPAPSLGQLTYRRVAELARSYAAALDRLGIRPGERVAIVSPNSARLLLALYGIAGSGRILVPVNFRLSPAEIAYIIDHAGASLLLVDPDLAGPLAHVPCPRRAVLGPESDALLDCPNVEPAPWTADENATATINYTSGTTARPKGVRLTQRSLWIHATTVALHLGLGDRDVVLHTVPTFHCNGWGLPFNAAGMGATQVILRRVTGTEVLRRVGAHGVTLLGGAPAVVNAVLDAAPAWTGPIPGRDRVRIIVGGAPPSPRLIERLETVLGWELIQAYGLTESSPVLTLNRRRAEWDALTPAERAVKMARAGAPILGVQVQVDAHGEVIGRGNVVFDGYWQDTRATAHALPDGWLHTGDGGTLDGEGYITISDRRKDVIITGGENVSSIEVEHALSSHPAVTEVAVIGVPDERWGEAVKALVVLAPNMQVTEKELIHHCRARIAHYKCPRTVEFRPELARTATGKLQKFKLRAPYWEGRTRQVN